MQFKNDDLLRRIHMYVVNAVRLVIGRKLLRPILPMHVPSGFATTPRTDILVHDSQAVDEFRALRSPLLKKDPRADVVQ